MGVLTCRVMAISHDDQALEAQYADYRQAIQVESNRQREIHTNQTSGAMCQGARH